MSIKIRKDGQVGELILPADSIQVLDIEGRFNSKNLEDVLKEVDSGTEENMTRIENKVEQLSNPNLFKNGNLNIWSTGTYFVNPNAWYTLDMWKQNADLSSGTISIEKTDNGMKITISEDAVSNQHYLLSTIQDFDYSLNSDLVASIKFKQSKANMLNFYGKVSNDIIGEYQILTQTLTEIKANSYFWFDIVKTGEVEIEYIKLEQGNVATKNNVTTLDMDYAQCYPYHKNISQPNLLINGDFQVWQRGEVFTTTENGLMLYSADRWHFWNHNPAYPQRSRVEKYNGHLKFTSVGNDWLRQHIEADLSGVPLTLSISVKGSVGSTIMLQMEDAKAPTDGSSTLVAHNIYSCTGGYDTFILNVPKFNYSKFPTVLIRSESIDVFEIEWVKLEYGSVATPFVPRPYSQELADCQRYYFRNQWLTLRSAICTVDQLRTCAYNFPVKMRVAPTIRAIVSQPVNQIYTPTYTKGITSPMTSMISPTDIGICNSGMCDFQFTINSTNIPKDDYTLEIKDNAYEFDAEIY